MRNASIAHCPGGRELVDAACQLMSVRIHADAARPCEAERSAVFFLQLHLMAPPLECSDNIWTRAAINLRQSTLAVDSRRRHGGLDGEAEIKHIHQTLHQGGNDPPAAWGADGQKRLAVTQHE